MSARYLLAGSAPRAPGVGCRDMSQWFEWDPEKARANLDKHRVSFEEAESAIRSPSSTTTCCTPRLSVARS